MPEIGCILKGTDDVGIDHVGGGIERGTVPDNGIDHAEIAIENAPNGQQGDQDDRRREQRQADAAYARPTAGPIDLGRFIELGIDAHQNRQVEDAAAPRAFPDPQDGQDDRPPFGLAIER